MELGRFARGLGFSGFQFFLLSSRIHTRAHLIYANLWTISF